VILRPYTNEHALSDLMLARDTYQQRYQDAAELV